MAMLVLLLGSDARIPLDPPGPAKPAWQAERVPCADCGAPVLTPDAHRYFHLEADALAKRFVLDAENAGCGETGGLTFHRATRVTKCASTPALRTNMGATTTTRNGISARLRDRAIAASTGVAGSPTESERLLGAVQVGREVAGAVRWPAEHQAWAGCHDAMPTALGTDTFVASWAGGVAPPVGDAVTDAGRARGKRRRPTTGWDSLTPTELEVVRHASTGLTNPQIAERMFVGRATVKTHLLHVFDKLGIASRSELAAEATRRDLASRKGRRNQAERPDFPSYPPHG